MSTTTIFRCSHATLTREPGRYPIRLWVQQGNMGGGFSVVSERAMREKLLDEDCCYACTCLRAWAASEGCWGCLDAPATEAIDGFAYCEACARAVREALPFADTLPPPAPEDERAEAAMVELCAGVLGS